MNAARAPAAGRASALLASALLAGCATQAQTERSVPADPFVRSFRALKPAVVLFTMNVPSDDKRHKNAFDEAYGSGVAIASGRCGTDIVKMEHVIHDAHKLRATLDDRRTVPAQVVGVDVKDDLALVHVQVPDRPVATLGSSAHAEAGMQIGIAGYPIPDAFADEHLGTRTSVYAGRVSSLRRDALELDLPVIPGESGGPVFDAGTGAVIGLAESRFDDEKAIGFGIPVEDVKRFLHRFGR